MKDILVRIKGDASDYERATKKAIGLSKDFASAIGTSLSISGAIGGVMFGVKAIIDGAKALIDISDKYSLLDSRLRLVTKSTAEFAAAQTALYKISQDARVQYESTVDLYTRLARSTDRLGISQKELLTITQGINKALIVSGASGESASAALIQLGQGMASGVLRGEELNSVLEQTPRLAQMIADGMGITIGQLREYGKDGKLSAEVVTKALLSQVDTINSEFSRMPETVGQAITKMTTVFESIVDGANQTAGATSGIASAIDAITAMLEASKPVIISVIEAIASAVADATNKISLLVSIAQKVGSAVATFYSYTNTYSRWENENVTIRNQKAAAMKAAEGSGGQSQIKQAMAILNAPKSQHAKPFVLPALNASGRSKSLAKSDANALESEIKSIQRQYDPLGYEIEEYTKRLAALAKYYDDKESLTGERDSLALKMTEEHMQKLSEISGMAKWDADLAALEDRNKIEYEIEQERYDLQLEQLREFLDNKTITEDEYRARREQAEEIHNQNVLANEAQVQDAVKQLRESAVNQGIALLGMFTTKSKAAAIALIAIEKAQAIASVTISTADAVAKAFAIYGPTPAGAAAAASMKTMGAIQIGLIAATGLMQAAQTLSGDSSTVTASNTSTAANTSTGATATTALSRTITVYGIDKNSLYSGDQIEAIVSGLNEYLADGGVINIA